MGWRGRVRYRAPDEKHDFADGKRPLISTQRLRNLVPVISLLFLRSCIAYASVTCRFDRLGPIGWRVFDSCLPRNGGATFLVSNNSALYKHSFVERSYIYVFISFIETIESVTRRSNSVPFEYARQQAGTMHEYPPNWTVSSARIDNA